MKGHGPMLEETWLDHAISSAVTCSELLLCYVNLRRTRTRIKTAVLWKIV